MLAKRSAAALGSLLIILFVSLPALGCACCADRGFYSLTTQKVDSFYSTLLSDLDLTGPAELYLSAAGFDGIKGLKEIENDNAEGRLDVTASYAQKTWRLNVRSGTAHSGVLWLAMPAVFTQCKADIDGIDNGLGVSLFKEFKISGRVSNATGMFRSAKKATKYTLVFHGRGNGCDDASDLTRWRVELDGPRADFAFFGKLKP